MTGSLITEDCNSIPTIFEDRDLLVVCKPIGISSIPERDLAVPSVRTGLERRYNLRLFTVHRLDKEVSGVLVFAKNATAHRYLNQAFFDRNVRKTYVALVHGVIPDDRGTIDVPIRQFGSGRMGVDEKNGKPSVTGFSVIERRDRYTLIEATPLTGRRHQIRVHLYHVGHPIAGDQRYGNKTQQESFPRLMLHAKSISWKKPDGQEIAVEASVPEEFSVATGLK